MEIRFSVTLNQTNVSKNNNKYYRIQLLVAKNDDARKLAMHALGDDALGVDVKTASSLATPPSQT